jgi:predicted glycosyltransferase
MKIWADLATAPQVLFLEPLIAEMRRRGHEVIITTREFTETVGLADRRGLDHTPVGVHGGKSALRKATANFERAAHLARLIRPQGVSLAVSQGSISQAIASACLRIPMVAMGDYEGNPGNHIVCRVAGRLIVPEVFCKANLRRYGAADAKIVSYPGIKEQVYLASFRPDPDFPNRLGIPVGKIVATMRPPSVVSAYHRFTNTVFDETLRYVAGHAATVVVLLPRGVEQRRQYAGLGLPNVTIPREVVDGPQLVYCSDLVVGAGGTMNREATVLGTPVYTEFQGQCGSVDEYLVRQGKMMRVVDSTGIPGIKVCKKQPADGEPWRQAASLVCDVVDRILQ